MSSSETEGGGAERRLPYDRKFHAAVEEGFLTVQQASARGNRQAMAERLARRHRLPIETALRLADNRITLADARARPGQASRVRVALTPVKQRATWPLVLLVVVLATALAGTAVVHAGRSSFQRAREMVRDFERGKPPVEIDYGHPVYQEALGELERVPGYSLYAARAAELSGEIRLNADLQRKRKAIRASTRRRNEDRRDARRAVFAAAVERDRLLPDDGLDSECEVHATP